MRYNSNIQARASGKLTLRSSGLLKETYSNSPLKLLFHRKLKSSKMKKSQSRSRTQTRIREMNKTCLIVMLLLTFAMTGCFLPTVSFDKNPPYIPIPAEQLPDKIERVFSTTYPGVKIEKIATRIWGPKSKPFYQLTFHENGKTMQVTYDHRGKTSRPATTVQTAPSNDSRDTSE